MKKAFDQNVSRAKPRLRLGSQMVEIAESASVETMAPEAFAHEPGHLPESVLEAEPQPMAYVEDEPAALQSPSVSDELEAAVKAKMERARAPKPMATEAFAQALDAGPEVRTVRAEPPPSFEEEAPVRRAAPRPVEEAVRRPRPAAKVQNVAPAAVEVEVDEAPATQVSPEPIELSPHERRERLKERLKAVRENPRPEPLPPTVAAAGVLAVERISTLQTEFLKLKALNLALTQDLEAARRQAEKATEDARARMDEARRLTEDMEARQKLLGDLERELSTLEGERDESLLALQETRQNLSAAKKENETLASEIAKREQALADSLSEEERMAAELESVHNDLDGLRRSLDALRGERDMLARQVSDLTSERAELLEARRALESVHRALSQARAR